MPDFIIRTRTTGPIVENTVSAPSREEAIAQTVKAAAEGESVEVMQVVEVVAEATPSAAE